MPVLSTSGPWAVYKMTIRGKPTTVRAICEQREWDRMEQSQPGHYPLIQGWIASEAEAERLAREAPPQETPAIGDDLLLPRR